MAVKMEREKIRQHNNISYYRTVYTLHETKEEKDLGIWTDPNLKFSAHIVHTINKAHQILGLIRLTNRSFTYMDMSRMKHLYIALVRPHLVYDNAVWHPHLKKDIQLLESVQQRATKLIPCVMKID